MRARKISSMNVMRYSEFVCSAVRLGVSMDDIICETRKHHGPEFSHSVEKVVKVLIQGM